MAIRVKLESNCTFDIGERTPERKAQVKQCVKAFMAYAAQHRGHPPGAIPVPGGVREWAWADANWEINYRLDAGRDVEIAIYLIRLRSGRGSY